MTHQEFLPLARAILFDMDGVLIDSEPSHEKSIIALSAELGEPIASREVLDALKGTPESVMASRLHELYPGIIHSAEQLIARKYEHYSALFSGVPLLPGVLDLLGRARARGLRLALTTSATRASQELSFRTHQLDPWFETVVTGEDIVHGKPDPEPYLLTASRLGLSPAECVVIEDSLNGVRSGKAAGCRVIAITTTFPRAALEALHPDAIIDHFDEIL